MNCQRCGARSQAALCRTHESDLRRMLQELAGTVNPQTGRSTAGWIEHLADAAVGTVRMGGDGGRKTRGDDAPIRFNDKASQLLQQVQGSLGMWVRDICESRGIEYEPVRFERPGFIGPLQLGVLRGLHYTGGGAPLALWLEVHVGAVLASEDAGQCFDEISALVDAISRMIDRREPVRHLGFCPTWNEDRRKACGATLRAPEDALEVFCRACRVTHSCDRLRLLLMGDLRRAKITWAQILKANKEQPEGFQVNERTLRDWRATGVLRARAWQRPCSCGHSFASHGRKSCSECSECVKYDGHYGNSQHTTLDVPLYAWEDIERLRAQRQPRGARKGAQPALMK
jgi:hypothetical protein